MHLAACYILQHQGTRVAFVDSKVTTNAWLPTTALATRTESWTTRHQDELTLAAYLPVPCSHLFVEEAGL